jgi:hypothetical protein
MPPRTAIAGSMKEGHRLGAEPASFGRDLCHRVTTVIELQ